MLNKLSNILAFGLLFKSPIDILGDFVVQKWQNFGLLLSKISFLHFLFSPFKVVSRHGLLEVF
jgi:hypothetical protein